MRYKSPGPAPRLARAASGGSGVAGASLCSNLFWGSACSGALIGWVIVLPGFRAEGQQVDRGEGEGEGTRRSDNPIIAPPVAIAHARQDSSGAVVKRFILVGAG